MRYLPQVVLATMLVVLTPGVVVWVLASSGTVEGFLPLVTIGLAISLAISSIGRLAWQSRSDSHDLLFSDLMLWGWVRRLRTERRLDGAMTLLGLGDREMRARLDPGVRIDVLKDLATSLEARDPYLHGHSRRVARYAAMIAEKMELPEDSVNKVRTAAAVHDVGKLEIPLDVLNKPGRLTEDEFDLIKEHAPRGAAMVSNLGDTELTEMVAHHHERLDGTGYPSRLAGEEIPIGARIIAVADTFDALTSTRAYRSARRHKIALGILRAEAGTQLDPDAVEAFDRCYSGSFGGLTVWALFAGLPHRLWAPVESQLALATGTVMSKAMTVVATTAATGGVAAAVSNLDPRDTSVMPDAAQAAVVQTASGSGNLDTAVDGSGAGGGSATGGRYDADRADSIRGKGVGPNSLTRGGRGRGSAGGGAGSYGGGGEALPGPAATALPSATPVSRPGTGGGDGRAVANPISDGGGGGGGGGRFETDVPGSPTPDEPATPTTPPGSGGPGIPPGHDPAGPGNSENAPGHDPAGPGNSENAPGHAAVPGIPAVPVPGNGGKPGKPPKVG